MKTRPGLAVRALLAVLLLAQLAGAAVPLADALLEGAAAHGVQMGSPSDADGLLAHVEGDCVLCQHIAHGRASTDAPAAAALAVTAIEAAYLSPVERPQVATRLLERGRSPPAV